MVLRNGNVERLADESTAKALMAKGYKPVMDEGNKEKKTRKPKEEKPKEEKTKEEDTDGNDSDGRD